MATRRSQAGMGSDGDETQREVDVFLCHNSPDKPAVKAIGEQLRSRGITPWLDEWELRPGLPWQDVLEEQIRYIKSAAVFVGPDGAGPWQEREQSAFLRQFVNRRRPVIPVILPGVGHRPEVPTFLEGMIWVDFRQLDPDPMECLIWGITGERPDDQRQQGDDIDPKPPPRKDDEKTLTCTTGPSTKVGS